MLFCQLKCSGYGIFESGRSHGCAGCTVNGSPVGSDSLLDQSVKSRNTDVVGLSIFQNLYTGHLAARDSNLDLYLTVPPGSDSFIFSVFIDGVVDEG